MRALIVFLVLVSAVSAFAEGGLFTFDGSTLGIDIAALTSDEKPSKLEGLTRDVAEASGNRNLIEAATDPDSPHYDTSHLNTWGKIGHWSYRNRGALWTSGGIAALATTLAIAENNGWWPFSGGDDDGGSSSSVSENQSQKSETTTTTKTTDDHSLNLDVDVSGNNNKVNINLNSPQTQAAAGDDGGAGE